MARSQWCPARFAGRVVASGLLIIGCLAWTAVRAENGLATDRLPVPDKAAQASAFKIVQEVFADEYASKDTAKRQKLAHSLLKHGSDGNNDIPAQFVLYKEATMIAADTGDVDTAVAASEELLKRFDLSPTVIRMHVINTLAKNVHGPGDRRKLLAVCESQVERLMQSDGFDEAQQVTTLAAALARELRDTAAVRSVQTLSQTVKDAQARYAEVAPHAKTLLEKPQDPQANLVVGKYKAFVKGDWEAGLDHLALGSDDDLRDLAKATIEATRGFAEPVKLADGWWDLAEKLSGKEQVQVRAYAGSWYEQAVPNLSGLTKLSVEKRLQEVKAAGVEPHAVVSAKKSEPVVSKKKVAINLIPLFNPLHDKVRGDWTIFNNELICTTQHFVPRIKIPYTPPEEYDMRIVFSQPNLRHAVCMILSHDGHSFVWQTGGDNVASEFSIKGINGQNPTSRIIRGVFKPDVKYETIVQVRKNGLRAFVNGQMLAEYATDYSDVEMDHWHDLKDVNVLGIGCDDPTTFHVVEVMEVTGTGKILREPEAK